MTGIQGPHDKIFKRVMTDRENAVSFLGNILAESIRKHLVLENIFYAKDSFIPPHLRDYYPDLLASVPVKGEKVSVRKRNTLISRRQPEGNCREVMNLWER
ncbi:MAG TPA: hypothetical protein ENN79_02235 [Desulfobacteraceae bacterium]|mgnify:CR=1 FL=1|nr:hypothetical protein [Desulfobacteraceae bacterium]